MQAMFHHPAFDPAAALVFQHSLTCTSFSVKCQFQTDLFLREIRDRCDHRPMDHEICSKCFFLFHFSKTPLCFFDNCPVYSYHYFTTYGAVLQMVEALPRGAFLFHRTQFPMKKWVQKIYFLSSVPIVYFRPATEFFTLPSPDFSLDRSYNKIHATYMITPTIAAAANVIGRTF